MLLRHIVRVVEPVSSAIFDELTASDVASFAYAIRVGLIGTHHERYLSPIRDLSRYETWLRLMLKSGHGVTLIGKDQ